MKYTLVSILALLISYICTAQDAVLYSKGETIPVKVKGSSNGGVFTDRGNFSFIDIDSFFTEDTQLKKQLGIRFNARLSEPKVYHSNNSLFIDDLPFNYSGKLIFTDTVPATGLTREQLYLKARHFFTEIVFKSKKDELKVDNQVLSIVEAKVYSKVYVTQGGGSNPGDRIYYTLKIQCYESSYQYSINDIFFFRPAGQSFSANPNMTTFRDLPGIDSPIEDWFTKESYYKKKGNPKTFPNQLHDELLRIVKELISSTEYEMALK